MFVYVEPIGANFFFSFLLRTGVHLPTSFCFTSLIPSPLSTNLFHRSSCHKRHHQTPKDIVLCSCAHHTYLQHKINSSNNPNVTANTALLCTVNRCIHSSTNMKPISEHYIEQSNSSVNDLNSSPPMTSNDEESGSLKKKTHFLFSMCYFFFFYICIKITFSQSSCLRHF